jgi:hypothetical protein
MGKMRPEYRVLIGKPSRRGHSENLAVYGKIVLKTILKK